jgi:hypothetical protein
MNQDPQVAVAFLEFMYPEGPWLLTAIPVERTDESGAPPTKTFFPGDDVAGWMAQYYGGGYNFYFSVNKPHGPMTKKASRLEIKEMCFLHLDLDPRAGEDLAEEQDRIEALLTNNLPQGIPVPSAVTYSGGGYWAFWRLEDAFPIKRDAAQYEEAKLYNLHLELLFGADSCHNVDRIARLPGTVNYPDQKKRKKGRVEALATVKYTNENVYRLSEFTKAPQVQTKGDGFSSGGTISISENVQRLQSLDELPKSVLNYTKVIIAQGNDPDDPNKWAEEGRSGALWYVCCELVRQGCSDDMIFAIITDPDWGISESVIDGSNGRGTGYATRQIERAREFAVDPKLAEFNNRYAVVQNTGGGACRIVYEEEFKGNKVMILQSPTDFKSFYANEFVTVGTIEKPKMIPVGKWWFEHPMRRSYRAIVFLPGQEVAPDVYNMWRGFAYEALPGGSCDKYLELIRDAICSDDEELYEYIINWMAMAVQQPWNPGHTAIVMRGKQGAGKGTFAKTFARLFGRHGKQITDPKHLTGHFNMHLRDCVAMFADEAVAAANQEQESMLKTLVTEESMMVTPKGKEASVESNFLHVIMASNAEWVVPVGLDDRRFVVLNVNDNYIKNADYWRALNRELETGGYEALLYMLTTRDLTGFDPRQKPNTAALQDQKMLSFDAVGKWWFAALQDGVLGDVALTHGALVPSSYLTWDFNSSVPINKRMSNQRIYSFLEKVVPNYRRRQATAKEADGTAIKGIPVHPSTGNPVESARPIVCELPSLQEMRDRFDENHGGPYKWDAIPEQVEEEDVF